MGSTIGPERNLLEPEPESCRQIGIKYPIIHNEHVAKLRHLPPDSPFRSTTLPMMFDPEKGGAGLDQAMTDLCRRASEAVAAGYNILILSDRGVGPKLASIPSLMATAGVHHHLVREGTRTRCGLVVESGDAREVHHVSLLLGYGGETGQRFSIVAAAGRGIADDKDILVRRQAEIGSDFYLS